MLTRLQRLSLRARLGSLVIVVTLVLAGAASVVGVVLVRLSHVQNEQTNHIDPADLTAADLFTALVDQETGIRGYALDVDDKSLLDPYTQGVTTETRDLGRLRTLLASEPASLAAVNQLESAAQDWRQDFAIPVLKYGKSATENTDDGKARFDAIRTAYNNLRNQLGQTRRDDRSRLSTAEHALEVAAGVAGVVLALAAWMLWYSLRRWVLEPLADLAADVRDVASGAIDHPVRDVGPRETADVGRDVESMRQRLVGELSNLEAARLEIEAAALSLERQAAELLRSNTDLEQFAYVASHDLQEPLRKVASFTQLLQERYEDQLDERANTYINFAVDGAKRMQRLISDLLAFSRVGRSTGEFRPVDLGVALNDALQTLSDPLETAGGEVVSSDLPTVDGDSVLLTQLMQNLVGNAIKFRSPDRPLRIEIGARREGEFWRMWCADNGIGIGIDPAYADKVFVIFQRLHGRDEYTGTGIGLALCKKIVEFHGGTIQVDLTESGYRPHGTVISWTLSAGAPQEVGLPEAVRAAELEETS